MPMNLYELMYWCDEHLRGVAPDPVNIRAELGVLDAVHFDHVHWGVVHAVVFVCQFVPCWL